MDMEAFDSQIPREALVATIACLVDMMGGSVHIHEYEYMKYWTDRKIELQIAEYLDPKAIDLKVVHRDQFHHLRDGYDC